jgi:hypothetical protein
MGTKTLTYQWWPNVRRSCFPTAYTARQMESVLKLFLNKNDFRGRKKLSVEKSNCVTLKSTTDLLPGRTNKILKQNTVWFSNRDFFKSRKHLQIFVQYCNFVLLLTIGQIWSQISKVYLGSMCTAVPIGWDLVTPPPPLPPPLGSYSRALLVSHDRRHFFVTPYSSLKVQPNYSTTKSFSFASMSKL